MKHVWRENNKLAARVQELLEYDPATGVLRWSSGANKGKGGQKRRPGTSAGNRQTNGYLYVGIDLALYRAHRLAWLLQTGEWPQHQIDHRNGVRDDNRWSNLREATHGEQQQNRKKSINNSSGFIGVHFSRRGKKWCAQISVSNKRLHLGSFNTAEEAATAYLAAKATHHPFQPRPRELSL